MKAPFPAPITNWHNDTYAAIDPTRPEVTAAGKTVVVTGGGSGIGRATVEAFAQAGAANIAITGRRLAPLEETKKLVESKYSTKVHVFAADVVDAASMKEVATKVGGWDVIVNNAGYFSKVNSLTDSDLDDWWKGWEINVKGTVVVWQAFHATAKKGAVFVGTATAAVTIPVPVIAGQTSYIGSKSGQIKMLEILAAEEKNISIRILHPGVVETDLFSIGGEVAKSLPIDKVELPAHFTVWFASPEGAFLAGRLVSCNWDVDELKAVADKVPGSNLFTTEIHGFGGPSLAKLLKL